MRVLQGEALGPGLCHASARICMSLVTGAVAASASVCPGGSEFPLSSESLPVLSLIFPLPGDRVLDVATVSEQMKLLAGRGT